VLIVQLDYAAGRLSSSISNLFSGVISGRLVRGPLNQIALVGSFCDRAVLSSGSTTDWWYCHYIFLCVKNRVRRVCIGHKTCSGGPKDNFPSVFSLCSASINYFGTITF